MRTLLLLAMLSALAADGSVAAGQPPAGSNLPPERNGCAFCHGEEILWEGEKLRLYVDLTKLADDVHWKSGVNCHDCHGGDPASLKFQEAHLAEVDASSQAIPFRPELSQQERSPAHLETIVQVCGKCHEQAMDSYAASVHGHGFRDSGLVVTAVCTDCHRHHGAYAADDPRSSLHSTNVAATCAACHRFIQDRLQRSVHGSLDNLSEADDESAAADNARRKPGCTDCHQGHDLPHPKSSAFRLGLPDRCGSCHAHLTSSYARSLHGEITELGYVPAAKCSDCHGSHDILPVSTPASLVSSDNRRQTCETCHPDASDNFLDFDPHADPHDAARDPILHWVNRALTGLLTAVFGIFAAHSVLWLVRSLPHVAKRGRPRPPLPGRRAYVRFRPVHRITHAVLMTSFLGLALTGLPLQYSSEGWALAVSRALGGFSSTALWHRIFGIANFSCLVFYIFWFASLLVAWPKTRGSRMGFIIGPDSPVPSRRDVSDFAKMMRWFIGRGPKPTFERWTYWEKFDIWAASADIVLIGSTGLILWFPNQFCELFPGRTLNIADLIHGKLALLATGFVFAVHFFSANLRPEKFPMDSSILIGVVSEDEMAEERPELLRRWRESGQIEQFAATTPSRIVVWATRLGGFMALALGLALLAAIVTALF